MNVFERQVAARRAFSRLRLLFALAALGIAIAVDLVVWLVFATREDVGRAQLLATMAFATVATLAAIGLAALHRTVALRDGGESLALRMGGVPVHAHVRDPQLRRLLQVAERTAIAVGAPMPRLYVLERESAINAFVAGHAPSDAAIAVTRGALDRLDRDELQGMVAHAFGQILDGGMRLNLRAAGLLYGLLMPAMVGRGILDGCRTGRQGVGATVGGLVGTVAGGAAIALGAPGLFFARWIKADIGRACCARADASAARFARQPAGLAGALKKIAALDVGAKLAHAADAEGVGHMLFADGVGLGGMSATHPSPIERIRALEPAFDERALARLREQWRVAPPNGMEEDARHAVAEVAELPELAMAMPATPAMVVAQVAQPADDGGRLADAIVSRMPAALRALAADRDHAATLALALLSVDDADVRRRQHAEIAARLGRETAVMVQAVRDEQLAALHPMQRLPLAALAFPTLSQRPRVDLMLILDTLQAAIHADGRVPLFEYGLGTLLHTQLREAMDPSLRDVCGTRRAADAKQEIAALLALAADAAHADPAQAQRAYLAGLQRALPRDHIAHAPPAQGVLALDAAWPVLDALDPPSKQLLVEGLVAALVRDGALDARDAERLRAVCGALHCPLPPLSGSAPL